MSFSLRRLARFAVFSLVALFAVGSVLPAVAQEASLLKNINDSALNSIPSGFAEIVVNGTPTSLFAATNSSTGRELWATDGTEAGTRIVSDLNLSGDSNPLELVVLNNRVYYVCETSTTGKELCVSDGTPGGTRVLANIRGGSIGSNPQGLTVVDNQLFFFASNGINGLELWVSGGVNGTTRMIEINPNGPLNRDGNNFTTIPLAGRYTATSEYFYFLANDGTAGPEVWRSNGSTTEQVTNFSIAFSEFNAPKQFTGVGDLLFFESISAANVAGQEIWVSDGTSGGTRQLLTLPDGVASEPQSIAAVGGEAYFYAIDDPVDVTLGFYRSDGTNTVKIVGDLRFVRGPEDRFIFDFDGRAVYSQFNPSSFRTELWISDGTSAGTRQLSTVRANFALDDTRQTLTFDKRPAVLNGQFYFVGEDASGNFGEELYRTDGDTVELVRDVMMGPTDGQITDIGVLGTSQVLFGANDGASGTELWTVGSSGTPPPPPADELAVTLDTRIAPATDFCGDPPAEANCVPVTPRSDTLETGALTPIVVRYVVRNSGTTTITEVDVTDPVFGEVVQADPVSLAPFDSVTYNRIYEAPATVGLITSRTVAVARDVAGNADTAQDLIGVRVVGPTVSLDTRIAPATDFCGDPPAEANCVPVAPRSDTLSTGALTPIVVRYVVRNMGTTTITEVDVTDPVFGEVVQADPVSLAPFDSVTYNRIYEAPATVGLITSRTEAVARDVAGNADTAQDLIGVWVVGPEVSIDVRVARAAEYCGDPPREDACLTVEPRSDTLYNLAANEAFVVRYVVRNRGVVSLARIEVSDQESGLVGISTDVLAPQDSVVYSRIYNAPLTSGINLFGGQVTVEDLGGNTAQDTETYGVQTRGALFRFVSTTVPASILCNNVFRPSPCSLNRLRTFQSDPALLQKAFADAKSDKERADREAVIYTIVNIGTLDLVRHTLIDGTVGTIFQDSVFTVERAIEAPSRDSTTIIRLFDAVSRIGESRTSTWTSETADGEVIARAVVEEPLPVELARFEADVRNREVVLQWVTSTEADNAGFEVQQFDATDGSTGAWQIVDFVPSAGGDATAEYRYEVGSLDPDVYRFRLRQIDASGRFAVSNEVEALVNIDGPYRFTKMNPNPVQTEGRFSITVREEQRVRIEMYDLLGRRVAVFFDGDLEAGRRQDLVLRVDRMTSGLYFLRAVGRDFAATERVTVVR